MAPPERFAPHHHRTTVNSPAGYDYASKSVYFLTICAREKLFGEVVKGAMKANSFGRIVHECWKAIPQHFPNATLDCFVIMPDHVHGILALNSSNLMPAVGRIVPGSLGAVVRSFKAAVSLHINRARGTTGPIWQRNYYEHVIRDGESLDRIRHYIVTNPKRWKSHKGPYRWNQAPKRVRTRNV
jgi:REP element-mobilizing transposase RayT